MPSSESNSNQHRNIMKLSKMEVSVFRLLLAAERVVEADNAQVLDQKMIDTLEMYCADVREIYVKILKEKSK